MDVVKHKRSNTAFRTLSVLTLVLAFLLSCAVSGNAAEDAAPTLTVALGSSEYSDSLRNAQLAVDLYLLATAAYDSGEDTYDFRLLTPYTGLKLPTNDPNADWQAVAQTAMAAALAEGTPVVTGAPTETIISQTDEGDALSHGLYLMLIRQKDGGAYAEDAPNGQGQVTVAYSGEDKFLFSPELVSLPTHSLSQDGPESNTNPGEWVSELTVYPKFVRAEIKQENNSPVVKTNDDTPLLPLSIVAGTSGLLLLILLASTLIRRRKK